MLYSLINKVNFIIISHLIKMKKMKTFHNHKNMILICLIKK